MPTKPETSYSRLNDLDRLIHEPARLTIMAVLAGCKSADSDFLRNTTELTKGNLSAHTSKLEQAGYVQIVKGFRGKIPTTHYSLTKVGRKALELYQVMMREALNKLDKTT